MTTNTAQAMEKPEWDKVRRSWSCPDGFLYPKCKGCGHNYFDYKPEPRQADGSYPDGGLCQWCQEEQPK